MIKFYFRFLFAVTAFFAFSIRMLLAQTTITTATGTTGYTATNGVGGSSCVTFVIENTNTYPILLNDMEDYKATSYPSVANPVLTLWYSSTSLSGAATISGTDWTQVTTTSSVNMVTGYNTIFTGLGFMIPAGAQYRFALQSSSGIAYSGSAAGNCSPSILSNAGVNLKLGDATLNGIYVGYAGAFPTPPNNPRWFTGSITFQPAGPCTSPPVPGTVVALSGSDSVTAVCAGASFRLNLANGTSGTGQTVQWQSSTDNITYSNISGATSAALVTTQAASTWYRAVVSCSGSAVTSAPKLITSPALVAGRFTINSAVATGGTNFQTFTDAINYTKCGVSGPVIFTVSPTSGPYTDQINIPDIYGTSAINTITINGNGRTLNFTSLNSSEAAGIKLNGAKYVTINNLIINGTGTATTEYNYGIHLLNNADFNTINGCTININTTVTSLNYNGIVISGSATSPTTTGSLCDNNTISNNVVNGGYYGITLVGTTTVGSYISGNRITNNTINDFYVYGIYTSGTTSSLIEGNDISRRTRTTTSTFYGIYVSGLSEALQISKNRIHDPFGGYTTASASSIYGIALSSTDATPGRENIISNNVLYNFNNGGYIYAMYNFSADSARYYYNTISLQDSSYTGTSYTYGFYQSSQASGVDFTNNIVYISRGGTGNKYCLYYPTTTSTIRCNYNNLLMTSTTGTANYIGYLGTAGYATLLPWQGAGFDVNSLSTLPVFRSPSTGDFKPTNMAMDNKGVPMPGITTDIVNNPRSTTTPDLGASEFGAPLPIKLLSIAASKIAKDVLVNWTTTSEINLSHYEVERSTDGNSFIGIGRQQPAIVAHTNNNYSYNDHDIVATATSVKLFYRLKMVDKDGNIEYTKVVSINRNKDAVELVKTYPSPFENELYLQVETSQVAKMQVVLTDAAGRILLTKNYNVIQGNNTIVINDLSKIQPGTYLVTATVNGRSTSTKVIK